MSAKPGPRPIPSSLKNRGVRKAFYVEKQLWNRLSNYTSHSGKEKSTAVNEAIQLYLHSRMAPDRQDDPLWSVVSLFSGCGGMDLGFLGGFDFLGRHYADHSNVSGKKFKIAFAGDIMKEACFEYRRFFGKRDPETIVVNDDIKAFLDSVEASVDTSKDQQLLTFPYKADVVIGGFPCQDFSVAGKRRGFQNERGQLYLQMKRVINLLNPKIFIAENVKGLVNLGEALEVIKADFANTGIEGYTIFSKLHHAADFGVPQTRERVFIVGVRKDLDSSLFNYPLETHSASPEETGLAPWVTAGEAIGDLLVENSHLPNQDQYSKARNYGRHCQGNREIREDYPGPTIRAEHHGNIEFHYSAGRRLSVRECARIQSFPDDFVFNTSASAAYKLIGNAVPPVLGWHIAGEAAKALTAWEERSTTRYPSKQALVG